MAARTKGVIVVAVIAMAVAALASVSLYKYLKGQEQKVEKAVAEAVATQPVVVAASQIPLGTPVKASQLKTVDWPKTDLPQGAVFTTGEVVGRVPIQTLIPGEPISEPKLMPKEGPRGIMTYMIPDGHRAMTVGVDQVSGVAGFITPENKVDVVLTAKKVPGYNRPLSKIVLQNIPVLATGQIIEQKDGKPVIVPTVTLDVTPDEAERLATASSEGRLRLLLRRSGDTEMSMTKGATVTRVIREAHKMRPVTEAKLTVEKKPVKRVAKKAVKKRRITAARHKPRKRKNVEVEVWRATKKTNNSFDVKEEDDVKKQDVAKKEEAI